MNAAEQQAVQSDDELSSIEPASPHCNEMDFDSLQIQRKVLSLQKDRSRQNNFHDFGSPNIQATPPSLNYLAAVASGENPKPITENGIDLSEATVSENESIDLPPFAAPLAVSNYTATQDDMMKELQEADETGATGSAKKVQNLTNAQTAMQIHD